MDNLNSPAYPLPVAFDVLEGRVLPNTDSDFWGFTKLELASLMAMQWMLSNSLTLDQGMQPLHTYQPLEMASMAVQYAKAVLEEANK